MAFSDVATVGFAIRNIDKTSSGDLGRLPVAVGQTYNALKSGVELNKSFAKSLRASASVSAGAAAHNTSIFNGVVNGIDKAATGIKNVVKEDAVLGKLTKGVVFASEHVNGLIVASSGLKVLTAKKEDRKKTIISEAGCLAGMFLGEGWMKKNLNGIINKLPVNAKWKPIIKGLVFIGGSIGASTIGQKIGDKIANYWDKPLSSKTENPQKGQTATIYQQMDFKA